MAVDPARSQNRAVGCRRSGPPRATPTAAPGGHAHQLGRRMARSGKLRDRRQHPAAMAHDRYAEILEIARCQGSAERRRRWRCHERRLRIARGPVVAASFQRRRSRLALGSRSLSASMICYLAAEANRLADEQIEVLVPGAMIVDRRAHAVDAVDCRVGHGGEAVFANQGARRPRSFECAGSANGWCDSARSGRRMDAAVYMTCTTADADPRRSGAFTPAQPTARREQHPQSWRSPWHRPSFTRETAAPIARAVPGRRLIRGPQETENAAGGSASCPQRSRSGVIGVRRATSRSPAAPDRRFPVSNVPGLWRVLGLPGNLVSDIARCGLFMPANLLISQAKLGDAPGAPIRGQDSCWCGERFPLARHRRRVSGPTSEARLKEADPG